MEVWGIPDQRWQRGLQRGEELRWIILMVSSNYGTGLRGGNLVDIRTGSYSTWEARFYNYGGLCRVVSTARE